MTAPAIPQGTLSGINSMDNDEFMQNILGESPTPPPDPTPPKPETKEETAPAPKAGVSVSDQPQAEAAPDVEVEEVEMTPEEADAERTAAGWKKNIVTGQWQRKDGTFAKEGELPPVEREATPRRELLTKFEVKRKGAVVDPYEVADDEITANVDGKPETHTVDKWIRIAQAKGGEVPAELKEENARLVTETAQAKARLANTAQSSARMAAFIRQILEAEEGDELNNIVFTAREKHATANSPEARQARLDARERALNEQEASRNHEEAFNAAWAPVGSLMDEVEKKYPDVLPEAIQGRYNALMLEFLEHGVFPLANVPRFHAKLTSSLVPWVEQLHEKEQKKTAAEREAAKLETEKARADRIQSKRLVSRMLKPTTTGDRAPAQKPKGAPPSIRSFMESEFGALD